jgi:lysophospholipase L1-like esterase
LNRVNQILALAVSLLFVALVFEGGLRLFGFTPRRTMNQFDSELGWVKTPSTSLRRHTSEFDVTLRTNSRGLREDESVGYEKPDGVTRILLDGDSFALGYTVERADTLSQLIAERLRSEGRDVQVINGGTEGYSTDQEVLWLMKEGVKYSPDVVILQMFENDIYWNGQDRYLRYPKPKLRADLPPRIALKGVLPLPDPGPEPWLERHSALGNLLGGLVSAPQVPMLSGPHPIPAEWGVRIRDDDAADGWPETRAALRAFRAVTEDMHAKPLVLVIPEKAQVDPNARRAIADVIANPAYDPNRPYNGMVAAAKAAGLPVVDTLPAMVAASDGGAHQLYFGRDWHTNAVGNRVLAKEVEAALAAPQLLGPPPHAAPPLALPATSDHVSNLWRNLAIAVGIWLVLGTLYARRFPKEGALRSYASVGGLICGVVAIFFLFDLLNVLLPLWIARIVSELVIVAVIVATIWYLRARIPVMAELFGTFVRRGQWYMLPVLVGLLSLGGLLVVAASSPWLAPFIYTLF